MRTALLVASVVLCVSVAAAEEKIRGVLEKTIKAGACAQITDALNEIYYINKTEEAEKLIADYVGKNIKVTISGKVEQKEGDPAYYFNLRTLEKHTPPKTAGPEPREEKKEPPKETAPSAGK